ncbi:uncharacterized protein LOC134814872 isoform X2 [Bolinopsis microptera]|uniref:uncharacterized protein LOC134814872 isoform X2 n=1 Tax=Bolinopsis microptera TaxID=2820187 RepID=UPI003078B2C4
MQPAGRHYRTDQRETDPVVVRAMKSPIVFSPQVGSQRPNSSKLMSIPSGKPQSAIYSNNRFPPPGLFSTKVVAHDPSISAFTVPATRSSAFNRVSAIQNPVNTRRNVVFKEEQGATRMVWHGPSSNEQVYRMAQITSQQPANGTNSIIQIPQSLQNHPGIYIDQSSLASQFYPYHQNSAQNSSVPIVINPRDINNSNIGYLTTPLNQAHRPPILRKLSKPSERPNSEDHKDNGQAPSYSHGDPSVYSLKEKGANAKHAKMKPPNSDPYLFADSPRKKPRKQAVVAHEDVFASNVPQSSRMEGVGASTSYVAQPTTVVQEQTDEDYMSLFPPRKRMSLLPPSSKCPSRLFNHFERHSDIKVKKKKNLCEPIPTIAEIASQGWQLLHLKAQLEDISQVQRDTKSKLCEYKDYFCNISLEIEDKGSGARAGNDSISDLLQNISHCCQSNVTQLKQTMTTIDKLLNTHKPKILDLAKEFKDKTSVKVKKTPPYSTPTQQKKTESAAASSSSKRTRKRKT